MYILAYKDGHDPAACLMKDGVIIAAAEEERFTRAKHAPGAFPKHAIEFCLNHAQITPSDISYAVYARLTPLRTALTVLRYYLLHMPITVMEWRYCSMHMRTQVRGVLEQMRGRAGFQKITTLFPRMPKPRAPFDHHRCHAASAFLFSPFTDSLVITWDGKGEATSTALWAGTDTTVRPLKRWGVMQSIGLLYSTATKYLGFTPNDGEYKVMGLAPFGKPGISFKHILQPDRSNGYRLNSKFALYPCAVDSFVHEFGSMRAKDDPMNERDQNIAYALQEALEAAGTSLARFALTKWPSRHLCLAGGVALNVKLNRVLRESGLFEDIFVQPASGDDGLVFGAAALMHVRATGTRPSPLANLYLGTEYDDTAIENIFHENGIEYTKSEDVASEAADLLSEGKVLAWYQGRMEFGPRALGARSVLANPAHVSMRDLVNAKIKFREEFRPFCPSILSEYASELLEHPGESPFMILSFAATQKAMDCMPAVVHVDGTLRPQTVAKDGHSRYRALIEAFHARTGIPGVLNTSLNVRGEPIVESPHDLIAFFRKTNIDAIVAGSYIAHRTAQNPDSFKTLSRETLETEF